MFEIEWECEFRQVDETEPEYLVLLIRAVGETPYRAYIYGMEWHPWLAMIDLVSRLYDFERQLRTFTAED